MVWKFDGFQIDSDLIFVNTSLNFSMKNELTFENLPSLIEISGELPVHAKKGDSSKSYKATKFDI